MSTSEQSKINFEELGKASRRAASVSALGLLLTLAGIGYAIVQLHNIEKQRNVAQSERDRLEAETERYREDLNTARSELEKSREALSTARAAINAFHAGNLNEALALYNEALASDPNNAYLQNLRAYTLFRLGRVNDAIAGERRSIALDPNYAWGYFDLARFLCASSPPEMDQAKKAAAEAVELRPDLRTLMENDGEFERVCKRQIP